MPVICKCTNPECGRVVTLPCGSELFHYGNIEAMYPKFCQDCGAPMTRENLCQHGGSWTWREGKDYSKNGAFPNPHFGPIGTDGKPGTTITNEGK